MPGARPAAAYHLGVASPAAIALLGLTALIVGLVVGTALGSRRARSQTEQDEASQGTDVGSVLGALRASAVLLTPHLDVEAASPSAYAYRLVRAGTLAVPEIEAVAVSAVRSGEPHEGEVVLETGRTDSGTLMAVRAAPLNDGSVLLLCEDRTQNQRVDEARRDFVANISHELKTPIGAIGLLSEAIADAADDPEAVRRFASRLDRESSRLSKLVTEIIELSRLQFDNPVESARAVRVDTVIAEAMDRVRSAAELKNIRLVRGGPVGLQVIGDKDQLVTAVNNLIDNAVAYSPEHTRVAVGVREREDAVEITVSDQGIGIPEDEQGRIFERFYRVDPARSRQTGGTGLGLSIVKHIAAAHRGSVSVWSSHGAGSTVTLRLPRHPMSDGVTSVDEPPGARPSVTKGTA